MEPVAPQAPEPTIQDLVADDTPAPVNDVPMAPKEEELPVEPQESQHDIQPEMSQEVVEDGKYCRIMLTLSRQVLSVNPRSLGEKIVTQTLEGGRVNWTPPLSTFDTIRPIDMIFGTNNKLHFYFQLNQTTWSLIGFHGNQLLK